MHADATSVGSENEVCFENEGQCGGGGGGGGNKRILYHKTNKEASTVLLLCSQVL